jgi:hypothetical protein
MLEPKLKDWEKIINLDFPPVEFTKETRQQMIEYAKSHNVGDARLAMGIFYTDAEYESEREKVLSTPLP